MRSLLTYATPLITGVLLALLMTIIAGTLTSSLPLRSLAFSAPAAHLAGILSGAPCVKDGNDYRLVGFDLDLTVVPACAAADYFCLMTGFLSLLLIWGRFRYRAQLFVIPAAWFLTIVINAVRLTACWQTDRLAQAWFPPSLWPATHMAVGIVTFLIGMVGVCWAVFRGQGSGVRVQDSEVRETDLTESGLTLSKQNTLSPEPRTLPLEPLNPEP